VFRVRGVFCCQAVVNDDTSVYISAFKPLPHTGDPLQITSVLAKTPGDQL
jgi:hypothetical protein